MQFDHGHHQKIHSVLNSLDSQIFESVGAFFGGGTLITLLCGEYRWSKDIDFICPIGDGYRSLRELVQKNNFRPESFFADTALLEFPRPLTANQYGLRFSVIVEDTPIKFEIVAEARIPLDPPEWFDWLPVPCLSEDDRFAEKLLANADRWPDSSVESRDLIDLAELRLRGTIPERAFEKAEQAYPVIAPLKKATLKFQESYSYRDKCFKALEIMNRAEVVDGIDLLAQDFGLRETCRGRGEN